MRTFLGLSFLLMAHLSMAQGVCRDEFVDCVSLEGDILACRSVYTNCEADQGNDLLQTASDPSVSAAQSEGLSLVPSIQNVGAGLTSIRLSISNASKQPIQVGNATYPINCADGSSDRAVFFMDFMLDAGLQNQSAGSDQLVCIGAGGAVSIDTAAAQIDGVASMNSELRYEFPCENGQFQWINLFYGKEGVFRWTNQQSAQGVINRDFIQEQSFAELACFPHQTAEPDLIWQARQLISQWMADPQPGRLIYDRSVSTGFRN